MRGQFGYKFKSGFCNSQKVWVMRVYGLRKVRVKRGSAVLSAFLGNPECRANSEFLRGRQNDVWEDVEYKITQVRPSSCFNSICPQ